jgi:hypothetical protein
MPMLSNARHARLTSRAEDADCAERQVDRLVAYLSSPKFQGADSDYVHIRTDLMPKLMALRLTLASGQRFNTEQEV